MTAEAAYLLAVIAEPGWTDATPEPADGQWPPVLRLTRGEERVEMLLRFNGGDPVYTVIHAPQRLRGRLIADIIRPARRRE